jgi:Peptidase C13 family
MLIEHHVDQRAITIDRAIQYFQWPCIPTFGTMGIFRSAYRFYTRGLDKPHCGASGPERGGGAMRGIVASFLTLLVVGCTTTPDLPPVPNYDAATLASIHLRAVVVAGDSSLLAFDHGADSMVVWLHDHAGIAPDDIQRLSTAPAVISREDVRSATLGHVMAAIEAMKPTAHQGCFVFITSHGFRQSGISLALNHEVLTPIVLDRALATGCGNAPTVVIVSGCYSGGFAQPPMTRANRIVWTAARADRQSFGCSANQTYTFFDQCVLNNLGHDTTWQDAFGAVRSCVEEREKRGRYQASDPQTFFGPAVADMKLPAVGFD